MTKRPNPEQNWDLSHTSELESETWEEIALIEKGVKIVSEGENNTVVVGGH